ncbi:MAG: ABC transporter permease [Bryobacterales bacterium]|nr:ABC transporter permease [Bryobacterales bacterium]
MNLLHHDMRLAVRSLRSTPVITVLAVLALALGIGANTALFSVVRSVLLRPLPYADPDRLAVALVEGNFPVAPVDYFHWREKLNGFQGQVAAAQAWSASIQGGDRPEVVRGIRVTPSMFPVLGVPPALGRAFADGERNTVVITHGFWQRHFASDPAVIGKPVLVDGEKVTIAGVMPASFHFAPFWVTNAEVIAPLDLTSRSNDRSGRSLRVFARLAPGVSIEAVQSEVDAYDQAMQQSFADSHSGVTHRLIGLHEKTVGGIRATLLLLLGTVSLVLLIACANVSHLLLVKSSGRRKEHAVHLALGATPTDLLRRSILESVILAAAGSAIGAALSSSAVRALLLLIPASALPRQHEVAVDGWVLAYGAVAGLLTGIASGLLPSWQALRSDVASALRGNSRGSTSELGQQYTRRLLIAGEVAIAVVLLVGAGLMLRTMRMLAAVQPGFDPRDVVTMTVQASGSQYAGGPARIAFFDRLLRELHAASPNNAIALTNHIPIQGDQWQLGYQVGGEPESAPGKEPRAIYRVSTPGYFQVMGIALRQGRDFTKDDGTAAAPVVIVNESLARRHWPGKSALGERFRIGRSGEWRTVTGVVGDVRQTSWTDPGTAEFYIPYAQSGAHMFSYMTIVARAAKDAARVSQLVTDEVRKLDRAVPVSAPLPMQQAVADQLWRNRVSAWMFGAFSMLALSLACLGVYGIASYAVSLRRREFGIRMALGADRQSLLSMVLIQEMRAVFIGGAVGLVASAMLARFLEGLVFGVAVTDTYSFVAAPVALLLTAGLAVLVPAWSVQRVDPSSSLRQE